MRGEFAAQVRAAVRVKGIAREIESYAVTGIHEDDATQHGELTLDNPGLQLHLNLDQMDAAARQKAVAELERVLEVVRRAP